MPFIKAKGIANILLSSSFFNISSLKYLQILWSILTPL